MALLVRAAMADKVGRLEDVLPTNHNFAQLVCRVARSCIKTAVIVIHFLLNIIRFVSLIDALVHRTAIDIGRSDSANLLVRSFIEGGSDQLFAIIVGHGSDPV